MIVGGLTAWYLGLRAGIIVAVVTFAALIAASFVPGMTVTVYALVVAWAAALYFFGPKISKAAGKSSVFGQVSQATDWARKFLGRQQK